MADTCGHNRSHAPAHGTGGQGRSHSHDPGGHSHAPATFGRAFAIGIVLNVTFVVLEIVSGLAGHSVALLSDGGHNLGDVLGLVVAWSAMVLAKRPPTKRFTYGLGGTSILATLFNAVILLVVIGALSWEAVGRLSHPEPVAGKTVMIVAAAGIVLNGFCAWLFASGRKDDLNARGAFVHMAADAVVSAGVVGAGLVVLLTGWFWLDPVVSLVINAIIVLATWSLLRDSASMALNAVPPGVDHARVDAYLAEQPGVNAVHDLHIWGMSTTETALTAHLIMPDGHPGDVFLVGLCESLRERFKIAHATIQIETCAESGCVLASSHVV